MSEKLCVRYRRDTADKRRLITVELVIDEAPLAPPQNYVEKALFPHPNGHVLVRIFHRGQAPQQAGAKRVPEKKLWQLPRRTAAALTLQDRIVASERDG